MDPMKDRTDATLRLEGQVYKILRQRDVHYYQGNDLTCHRHTIGWPNIIVKVSANLG